ncbi:MAG: homing endonuclease associated repeat-containing protein [bacterium]
MSKTYSDEKLINMAFKAAQVLKPNFTVENYREFYKENSDFPSYRTLKRRFDSWDGVIEAVANQKGVDEKTLRDVKTGRRPRYSRQELLNYLFDLFVELQKVPSIKDLSEKQDSPSASIYVARFGSWRNAVNIVVQDLLNDYNEEKQVS